ncbi:hypothetical protein AURDEDRAFT_160046 [Auricularia subglabra TFB-10046 SS5]|nr:hypothetical protein AURDEDRAFT_160046 [Auricularia subglabra TFB-10046 SS5]
MKFPSAVAVLVAAAMTVSAAPAPIVCPVKRDPLCFPSPDGCNCQGKPIGVVDPARSLVYPNTV